MKTMFIIIGIVGLVIAILRKTKVYNETKILHQVQKNLNNPSILQGLVLNNIKSQAAHLVMRGKISEDFYKKIFYTGTETAPWWEVNIKNIKG